MTWQEYNFDGIVGCTHSYAGLAPGNIASTVNAGQISNPRRAAMQGLEKMQFVANLGVGQAVLPPHPRPSLAALRRLGFSGTDEEILAAASSKAHQHLLRLCSSASAMWTANAATCIPSADAVDGRAHLIVANLQAMFHRAIEAEPTFNVLSAIFSAEDRFVVHPPLPGGGQFGDEGAANHLRLRVEGRPGVHLFAWGRQHYPTGPALRQPKKYPARQTREASQALARLGQLSEGHCLFPQQDPAGIDAGAFHSDVLAVSNEHVLIVHEKAFLDSARLVRSLRRRLGPRLTCIVATARELPLAAAVKAYPFNSQLVTRPNGTMALIAPAESSRVPETRRFLEGIVAGSNPVAEVHYLDVRQSMHNGGGPACLRLRVVLSQEERRAIKARVFHTPELHADLARWIDKHYRDRLSPLDLADVQLARECMTALDELTQLLRIGSAYDFQRVSTTRRRPPRSKA